MYYQLKKKYLSEEFLREFQITGWVIQYAVPWMETPSLYHLLEIRESDHGFPR